jgi:two-component system, chemotaxis family, sensor kinase CheA
MDEITKEFIIESNEALDCVDRTLVRLEKDPSAQDLVADIFRSIHTVKGTSGCLGFPKIEQVAHAGENLLSRMRDGQLVLTAEITSALMAMTDLVRRILASIERTESEGGTETQSIVFRLQELLRPCADKERSTKEPAPLCNETAEPEPITNNLTGEILVEHGKASPEAVFDAFSLQREGDTRRLGEILVTESGTRPVDVVDALNVQVERRSELSNSAIRVDVNLLDKVMNLVGELVLARNQVLQFTSTLPDATFQRTAQRLNSITTELQEGVMKTRMQPIGNVWNSFPRVVRDLSLSCHKRVRLEMEGAGTELDKTIIEAIKDPLTHIVRNSIDHGIESPEIREQQGKHSEGVIHLRAFHEGGQVNIVVRDDGAGVDCAKVKQKALEKGLISSQQLNAMSDQQVCNLLFLPGLSTATKVTNISGRGVGMDVVKTNIEKISGTVDIQSTAGAGTTVKIKIPLTLAIIPALLVMSGSERFAIPQVSLVELVRFEGESAASKIETIHGAQVYRLRGTLLPLVSLNRQLKLEPAYSSNGDLAVVNIVVLQAEGRQFGLIVDEINDTEEIVVKPLGKQLKGLHCFAGATILGDGRVALILDVPGLALEAHLSREATYEATLKHQNKAESVSNSESWLLFRVGTKGRLAVPLSAVSRLEEFDISAIELSDACPVIQYRGAVMPILYISELLQRASAREDRERIQVVVYSENGRNIGLAVDEILDIVDQHLEISRAAKNPYLIGSAILQEHVTDLLNVGAAVSSVSHDSQKEGSVHVL